MMAAALVLTAAANAQSGNRYNQSNPVTLRIGAAMLTDSQARDAVGSTGLNAGLSYDLPFSGLFHAPGERGSFDFDYLGFWRNGNNFNNFGFSYVERVPFSTGVVTGPAFYGGLGVGVWYDSASGGGGGSVNRTTIGGKALLGLAFDQKFSVELSYDFRPNFFGVSPNAFTLSLGYRF
jgi:hypothetical protein